MLKAIAKFFTPMETQDALFPGVEKPTTTLAKMIAAEMIADLPRHTECTSQNRYFSGRQVSTKKFEITFSTEFSTEIDTYVAKGVYRVDRPRLISFDDREKKILVDAFNKMSELLKKKRDAEKLEDNQRRAVDALAEWMGVEESKTKEISGADTETYNGGKLPDLAADAFNLSSADPA